mmetsp:Transcript_11973/g.27703  ORF Transcript_11973/g.27703 Transcript_11973/m.27703 type:complete len:81 (-) Transcript_11973:79-321(-)
MKAGGMMLHERPGKAIASHHQEQENSSFHSDENHHRKHGYLSKTCGEARLVVFGEANSEAKLRRDQNQAKEHTIKGTCNL